MQRSFGKDRRGEQNRRRVGQVAEMGGGWQQKSMKRFRAKELPRMKAELLV